MARSRWRQRRNFVLAGLVLNAWAVFCVAGAVGLFGRDYPWLVLLLSTAVFGAGIYLAVRVLGNL